MPKGPPAGPLSRSDLRISRQRRGPRHGPGVSVAQVDGQGGLGHCDADNLPGVHGAEVGPLARITPELAVRRCTVTGSLEGRGGGPALRVPRSRSTPRRSAGWAGLAPAARCRGRRTAAASARSGSRPAGRPGSRRPGGGGVRARRPSFRFAWDRYAASRRSTSFCCSSSRLRPLQLTYFLQFVTDHARLDTVLDVCLLEPVAQARLGDPEVLGDLAIGGIDTIQVSTKPSAVPKASTKVGAGRDESLTVTRRHTSSMVTCGSRNWRI